MASRDDIDIFYHFSPRLIFVRQPATEVSIQDLHDTLSEIEAQPENLIYPAIIKSDGKQDLGGGISVGLTGTLLNAQIGFQSHQVVTASGIVTSTDPTGEYLTDSAANFTVSGVAPGSWVINLDDGSIATLFNIESTTQLRVDGLGAGDTNAFTSGDRYKVFEIQQVEVEGGNLVAIDNDKVTIDPLFPTAGNQALRTASAFGTTQNQLQLEHATFNGVVHIDVINGTAGTTYPTGTQAQPCKTIPDVVTIAQKRGFDEVRIIGDITLDTGDNVENYTLVGQNAARTTITINPGADTAGVQIEKATVTGAFDTAAAFNSCHLIDIEFVEANIHNCVLEGKITLSGTGSTSLYNCNDGLVLSAPPPSIDFGGSGRSLAIRGYNGDLLLENKTGPESVEINISTGGRITVDSTVTNGLIRCTGTIEVIDNSTGLADVNTREVVFPDQVQLAAFNGAIHIDPINGVAGTKFPQGTYQSPVQSLVDAITISNARGLDTFSVNNTLVCSGMSNLDNYKFIGQNPLTSVVVLPGGCSTDRTNFANMILTGEIGGPIFCRDVGLQNLTNIGSDDFPSIFDRCIFREGSQVMSSGLSTPQNVHFIDCASGVPGDGVGIIDMNGSEVPLAVRNYVGSLELLNYSGGHTSTVGFGEGRIITGPTCTDGVVNCDGIVFPVDTSGPDFTLKPRSSITVSGVATAVWNEPVSNQTDSDTMGGYVLNKILTVARFLGLK